MAVFTLGTCTLTNASGSITTGNQWNTANYVSAYLQVWQGGTYLVSSGVYTPPPGGTGKTTGTMTSVPGDFSATGTYTVKAFLDGVQIGSATFEVPRTPMSVNATQPTVGVKSVNVTWSAQTSGATYIISARVVGADDFQYKTSTTGASASITVDSFANYQVAVRASIDGRVSPSYGSGTINVVDTPPLPTLTTPTISTQSVTKTSISITLSDVDADMYYANINGGSYQSGSGRSFSFTGLTSGQTYAIRYKATKSGYNDSAVGGPTSITTATNLKPDPWSWTASNGSASSAQTQAAYNAVTKVSGYNLSDFSYLVWNDLVDKVDAFAVYKSSSAVASGAKMTSGDKALSALRFNKVLTAVNAMASTGITSRSAGDLVYGSYFTTITTTINNIAGGAR